MNPQRKPRGFFASKEGLERLQAKKREKRYTYEEIRKQARVTLDQVKRLFNPKWGYKIGSEAIELIAAVLDLQPEEIVGFDAWNSSANDTELEDTQIDWRDICHKMLEAQQESARLRRKATEQGFEINVYVPLGLVERKQQQRRQQNEQLDRENVYELTQEVIVKTYEHGEFLKEVIAQQSPGNNKHIAIIGEPGAGKTTLLSTIAAFMRNNTQDLPIFISLANLQGRTIEEYLLKQWLPEAMRAAKLTVAATPEIEHQFSEYFAQGGVWLLLDGVDEMGENTPVQALAKINQELTPSLRQARVVLTCRLNVWDAKVSNPLTGFDTYKTQEFKPEQIDDFIHQWYERAGNLPIGKTLQAKLKETKHGNIRKLVTNPLRLSLLCQTFDYQQGELPETKAALYQRFTRYFYEWKSELFPELYQSDDLKNELHDSLSRLAFAGINSSARFRLRRKLAHQEMGERLLKLACDVGWLNLVDRIALDDEEVYAFFHPNFQEYFAALKVNDWQKDFFNHVLDNPAQGIYRIFEPQWKEVILLWLGRKDISNNQKEEFIKYLVEFADGCLGLYSCQSFFIAAAGIREFQGFTDCNYPFKIVRTIVDWSFGSFDSQTGGWFNLFPEISQQARKTLYETNKNYVISILSNLLSSYVEQLFDLLNNCGDEDIPKIYCLGYYGSLLSLVMVINLTLLKINDRNDKAQEILKKLVNFFGVSELDWHIQGLDCMSNDYINLIKDFRQYLGITNHDNNHRTHNSHINAEIKVELLIEQISNFQDEHEFDGALVKLINGINKLEKYDFVLVLQRFKNRFDSLKDKKSLNLSNTNILSLLWYCAQNIPYPYFYNIWNQGKNEGKRINNEEVSLNHLDLPQHLQAAIHNDAQLSQNIHLICIDTSKFIDPDNPASKIYTTIVKAGCPKYAYATPKTMAELQTYWEFLETDKRVVLMFYPGATNTTDEVTYSDAFLNAISKFDGAICFIGDPIPNYKTLKVFALNQPVDEILEWLRRS